MNKENLTVTKKMKTIQNKIKDLLENLTIEQSIKHCIEMCKINYSNAIEWNKWALTKIELEKML